jgi:predicted metal-dependent hydrolase
MCKTITHAELQHLTDKELSTLFNEIIEQLYREEPGSDRQMLALDSLDNVRRVIAQRANRPRPPCL